MKVAALTSGANTPSARFRVRQYIPYLSELGIDVTDHCPAINQGARLPGRLGRVRARYVPPLVAGQLALNFALRAPGIIGSYRADLTWLERNFVPGLDDLACLLKRPLVVDIDDAIWLYNPLGATTIKRLLRRADMVFAGNAFLADWCSAHNSHVQLIPTAVDANRFCPPDEGTKRDRPFVIGWTGTSGNFRFLTNIEAALSSFLRAHPDARFLVIADRRPELPTLPPEQCLFERWSPDREHLALRQMNVGIMPIDDSDLSRGKCSFKMLQYMATGLPVVASPFGMNGELLNIDNIGFSAIDKDSWMSAFEACRDETLCRRLGSTGRSIVEARFSTNRIAEKIGAAFDALRRR